MKTFTIDEAQSLLPVLEALLKRAIEGKRQRKRSSRIFQNWRAAFISPAA